MIEHPEGEEILQGLSAVMGGPARFGSTQRVEERILSEVAKLSPIEAESFASTLGNVGNFLKSDQVRGIAATAVPLAARAVGTAYLGPAGGAVVGSIGDKAGQAIAGKPSAQPSKPAAQPVAAHTSHTPGAEPAPASMGPDAGANPAAMQQPTGSAAAAQALSMLRHPALESSLCSLILGMFGKESAVGTGNVDVPVGAMMVLMRELFERAAQDAESILAARQDAPPAYLLDTEGCLSCDPAVPSQRADALLRFLQAQRSGEAVTETCGCAECAEGGGEWAAAGW